MRSVALAGEWRLPPTIREAMRAWRFDVAEELLTAADAVLAQRDQLEASAAAAGATLPTTLRTAFEGAGGVGAAAAEATAEQSTVDAIAAAQAARPVEPGIVDQAILSIGLLPDTPETQVAAAHAALAAGDLQAAYASADAGEERVAGRRGGRPVAYRERGAARHGAAARGRSGPRAATSPVGGAS